jgi:hypothetical protein
MHGGTGIEAAGKRDADLLADGELGENRRHACTGASSPREAGRALY